MRGSSNGRQPLVAVCLGTDPNHFDRLIGWVSDLARGQWVDWFVQHGHTPLPERLSGSPMLDPVALAALLEMADVVVTHGGPAMIMEARAAGHVPIVVPRRDALGEHSHELSQELLADRLSPTGTIRVAASREQLEAVVRRTLASLPASRSLTTH
ncbi:MAG: hypothetical protein L0H93_15610 [Nocardioides sp.]|nr:hypothetical protein [Nocardioides sp.]